MAQTGSASTSKGVRPAKRAARAPDHAAAETSTAVNAADSRVLGVAITHPDRQLFTDPAITKLDLARYYESVAAFIMPHLANRRVALLRCPEGIAGECFFQKHMHDHLPAGVEVDGDMLVIRDIAGVIGLVQRGVIEFHTWGAKLPGSDKPDRLTFDLDPDPSTAWRSVAQATRTVRDRLVALGLTPFLKTTGGKGLHVVVPIRATLGWDEVRGFCKAIAQQLEHEQPDVFVANMAKAKRQGHIFIDYLRNSDGATAVAAFSVRARGGAPVAMPISWDVLDSDEDPRGPAFNVRNVVERIHAWRDDPWAGYAGARKALTAAMRRAAAAHDDGEKAQA
ncbi:ATP-dependent DNA ligase [Bordetella sputigena]|uniref:non-homologous end-joining DNA ligase n=1 Tax=Bordetella sputigena TaxID=1416810 RepID=UPI0039EFDC33